MQVWVLVHDQGRKLEQKSGAPLSLPSPYFPLSPSLPLLLPIHSPFPLLPFPPSPSSSPLLSLPLLLEVGGPHIAAMGLGSAQAPPAGPGGAFWCNVGFLMGLLLRFCDWKKTTTNYGFYGILKWAGSLLPFLPFPPLPFPPSLSFLPAPLPSPLPSPYKQLEGLWSAVSSPNRAKPCIEKRISLLSEWKTSLFVAINLR